MTVVNLGDTRRPGPILYGTKSVPRDALRPI